MDYEIDKALGKLNAIANFVSDFRKNVYERLARSSEPLDEAEYNESVTQIVAVKESVSNLGRDAKKTPGNEEETERISRIAKQIITTCDQIIGELPRKINRTSSTTKVASNKRDHGGENTEFEASESAKTSSPKNENQADKGSDMDQNEYRVYDQQLQDLLKQIEKAQEGINHYREQIRLTTDFNQKEQHKKALESHKKAQSGYFKEYDKLKIKYSRQKGTAIAVSEIRNLENKIDSLRTDFFVAIETILQRFDDSDKTIISSFSDIIDESKAATIDAILTALNNDKLDDETIKKLAILIETDLAESNRVNAENPSLAKRVFSLSEQFQYEKAEIEVKHLVKLSIPIIPGIIKYETSLGLKGTKNLKKAWDFLVKHFGPKKGA